jgi:hypothetical protein
MIRDVLQHAVDAAGNQIKGLGPPTEAGDATFTDNVTPPSPPGQDASPGASRLAAPADHVHPDPTPTRIAARGVTTIAANARVTLARFKRSAGEIFPPGGYVFVKDDKDGATWENEVDGGTEISTYHERTATRDELRFRGFNGGDNARTIEWATVALMPPT